MRELPVVREDSASINLVTDPRAGESLPEIWTLSADPVMSLGSAAADAAAEAAQGEPFLFTRIGDLVPLAGGVLAVVDGGSRELRFFASTGEHLRSLGGAGDGPGRFGAIHDARRVGPDTVVVWDARNLRVSHLTPDEGFVRSFPLDVSAGSPPPRVEVPADGSIVVASELPSIPDLSRGGWQPRADSLEVQRFHDEGRERRSLGQFAAASRASGVVDMGQGRMAIQMPDLPFGHDTFLATLGDRVVVAHSREFALRVYGPGGDLEVIWRFPGLLEPLSPGEVERMRERAANGSSARQGVGPADGGGSRITLELLDTFGTPSHRPAMDRILPASPDELWVRRYRWDTGEDQLWWVLSAHGEAVGKVRVAASLDVRAVQNGQVYTVREDDLGVERIEVFRLMEASGAR